MKRHTLAIIVGFVLVLSLRTSAQTSAFNFQGRLNDGASPANGRYDLQFKLFSAIAGGAQLGSTVDRPNLQLINGVFSTVLDFGAAPFNSADRFVEISVRPNGSPNAYVILGARQQILAVPFAIRAVNSSNADFAQSANSAQTATTAQNSLSLGGIAADNYARLSFANQGDIIGANLVSNGSLSVVGNAIQPASASGFAKAMVAIGANGSMMRCYNGITGSASCNGFSTNGCGTVGQCLITFPFQVSNRYWLVVADSSSTTYNEQITASVGPTVNAQVLEVFLWKDGSHAALPFHLFVF